jgi:hypothetical protein
VSMHRIGVGDHPSQQIDVVALRERLHLERLAAFAATRPTVRMTSRRRPEPPRLTLTTSARRHLAAVSIMLVFLLGALGAALAMDEWRSERNTTGYIRACISCHARVTEQPSASPS